MGVGVGRVLCRSKHLASYLYRIIRTASGEKKNGSQFESLTSLLTNIFKITKGNRVGFLSDAVRMRVAGGFWAVNSSEARLFETPSGYFCSL